MKILKRFLIGVSFVVISACGGSSGGGGDDDVAAVVPVNDNPCGTVVDIDPDSMVDGKLEAGDCLFSDLDLTSPADDSFTDEYRVTLIAAGTLTIDMKSTDLDAWLALLDRDTPCSGIGGCTIAQAAVIEVDDDDGGGTDARISLFLMPGTYIIVADSIVRVTGDYTLETTFVP